MEMAMGAKYCLYFVCYVELKNDSLSPLAYLARSLSLSLALSRSLSCTHADTYIYKKFPSQKFSGSMPFKSKRLNRTNLLAFCCDFYAADNPDFQYFYFTVDSMSKKKILHLQCVIAAWWE